MRCAGVEHHGNPFCSVSLPTKGTPNLFFSFQVFPLFVFLLVLGIIAGWVCLFVCVWWGELLGIAQAGLKLMTILLPQPSEYLNYRHALPHLASHSYLLMH